MTFLFFIQAAQAPAQQEITIRYDGSYHTFNTQDGSLDLRNQELNEAEVISLAFQLCKCPHITKLYLRGSHIGDDGMTALAPELFRLQNLKTLYLDFYISDKEAQVLAENLPPMLKEINLTSDESLKAFTENIPETFTGRLSLSIVS